MKSERRPVKAPSTINTEQSTAYPEFGSLEHRAWIAQKLSRNQRFRATIADFLALDPSEHRRRARELVA
jgi:energy-coupling factor transporter ATP-binding protein EcfA2